MYSTDYEAMAGAMAGASLFSSIISLAICVLMIVGIWKMFEKAGEAGWKSLIPFYNSYILYKMATGNGWLFLIAFIPVVGALIATILLSIKLAKAFGKGTGFAVGLFFLTPIFYLILGFGSAEYEGV